MSCTRPSNFTLRRQNSLACECQPIVSTHERRLRLQKQYSVDQNRGTTAVSATHRSTNNVHNVLKCENSVNTLWNCSSSSPEASLRIFTAIKNSTQHHGCETNEKCVFERNKNGYLFALICFYFVIAKAHYFGQCYCFIEIAMYHLNSIPTRSVRLFNSFCHLIDFHCVY